MFTARVDVTYMREAETGLMRRVPCWGLGRSLSDVQPPLSISAGRDNRKNRKILIVPALGHALEFLTWRFLVHERGLTDEEV